MSDIVQWAHTHWVAYRKCPVDIVNIPMRSWIAMYLVKINNGAFLTHPVDWAMAVACCSWDSHWGWGVALLGGHCEIERVSGDPKQTNILLSTCTVHFSCLPTIYVCTLGQFWLYGPRAQTSFYQDLWWDDQQPCWPNYTSHVTLNFFHYAQKHKIIVMGCVPHMTHLCQGFDAQWLELNIPGEINWEYTTASS